MSPRANRRSCGRQPAGNAATGTPFAARDVGSHERWKRGQGVPDTGLANGRAPRPAAQLAEASTRAWAIMRMIADEVASERRY
jgi:hypothetical protein